MQSHFHVNILCIGLYRDVWIAAIASSRTNLATLTGVMCNTSQCEITFVTRKFGNVERNVHCDVLHITPVRVARLVLDCNGVFAIKAYCLPLLLPVFHSLHTYLDNSFLS